MSVAHIVIGIACVAVVIGVLTILVAIGGAKGANRNRG